MRAARNRPAAHRSRGPLARKLQVAGEICRRRGARLTGLRIGVLATLLLQEQPLTAYELIPLCEAQLRRKFAPPSIYRALGFLIEQRLVAKIESRNAYIACANPDAEHACMFLVCARCGTAQETENHAIEDMLGDDATRCGFQLERPIVEVKGLCARCRAGSEPEVTEARPRP
jgi:Fur family zinc uptake transcriptional regulator